MLFKFNFYGIKLNMRTYEIPSPKSIYTFQKQDFTSLQWCTVKEIRTKLLNLSLLTKFLQVAVRVPSHWSGSFQNHWTTQNCQDKKFQDVRLSAFLGKKHENQCHTMNPVDLYSAIGKKRGSEWHCHKLFFFSRSLWYLVWFSWHVSTSYVHKYNSKVT